MMLERGFEIMRMFKKGQMNAWKCGQGFAGESRLIEKNSVFCRIIKDIKALTRTATIFCNRINFLSQAVNGTITARIIAQPQKEKRPASLQAFKNVAP